MTPKQAQQTLEILFTGHKANLSMARRDIHNGTRARDVASRHITPILADIERNAGQPMDPTYIAYLIEYAYTQP